MLPFISIVVGARNERAMLPRLIDDLLRQNYPPDRYEILLVDRGSSDGTAELVRRRYAKSRTRLRVIEMPSRSRSAGRNAGIREAAGDLLVFIEGRCRIPSPNLLEDAVSILETSGADCLCSPLPPLAASATDTGEMIARVRTSWPGPERPRKGAGFTDPRSGASIYRRRSFAEVGLYDESFDSCEDVELNTRIQKAGLNAYTDPRLTIHDRPEGCIRELLQQGTREGRAKVRLMRKHGDTPSIADLSLSLIVLSLLLALPAWLLLPTWVAVLVSLPTMLFVTVVIGVSGRLGWRHGVQHAATAASACGAICLGKGVGMLLERVAPSGPRGGRRALEALPPEPRPSSLEDPRRAA